MISQESKELKPKPILFVTGGTGLTGGRFVELLGKKTLLVAPSHDEFNLLWSYPEILNFFKEVKDKYGVAFVINFAAVTDVDGSEKEKEDKGGVVWRTNVEGATSLARMCKTLGLEFVHISTDYVFSGKRYPHKEDERSNPVDSWYAQSKVEAEEKIIDVGGKIHIVRIQMPFTHENLARKDFPRIAVERLMSGKNFAAVVDQYVTPVYVDDCAEAIFRIAHSQEYGVWHVSTPTIVTPNEFAHMIVQSVRKYGLDLDESLITETTFEEFSKNRTAVRPKDNAFDIPNGRFVAHFGKEILRPLAEMLDEWAGRFVPNLREKERLGIYV